jgi:hypothetical protein
MMTGFRKILLLSLLTAFVLLPASAQEEGPKTRIGLVFPVPAEGSDENVTLTVSRVITETLSLTLKLLGGYEVIEIRDPVADPALFCEQNEIDNLVLTDITVQGRNVAITMSIYSAADAQVILTENRTVNSFLKIFDATDTIAVSLMEKFSGQKISYGALRFVNTGSTGPYWVRVDGIIIGESVDSVERILFGEHRIEIYQQRIGGELVVYNQVTDIPEGMTLEVEFRLPYTLEKEISRLTEADADWRGTIRKGGSASLGDTWEEWLGGSQWPDAITGKFRAMIKTADGFRPEMRSVVPETGITRVTAKKLFLDIQAGGGSLVSAGVTGYLLDGHLALSALAGAGLFMPETKEVFPAASVTLKAGWIILNGAFSPTAGLYTSTQLIIIPDNGSLYINGLAGLSAGVLATIGPVQIYADGIVSYDFSDFSRFGLIVTAAAGVRF